MSEPAPQGYYAATAMPAPKFAALSADAIADVCVIGGGYTGLSAALHLAQAGARTILLESQSIGFGASGRNGGQIHSGFRKDQAVLEKWLGKEHAGALWTLSEEAKMLVRDLLRANAIDASLKEGLVIAAHDEHAARELREDADHLARVYNYTQLHMMNAQETAETLGTSIYPAARLDRSGGHLHALNFARGLGHAASRAGARLHENSPALALETQRDHIRVRSRNAAIVADRVLLACDAFSATLAPELAPYIGHVESFIVATAPLDDGLYRAVLPSDAAVADTRHVLDYYRKSADRRLLFAGRESYWNMPHDIAALVRPRMARVYPALSGIAIDYAWSGTVGITRTRMPHFGQLSNRMFFAHGYSGQGVALATLGGKVLAEAALGRRERFDVLARVPALAFPGGAWLRRPLVAAALAWFKLMDRF